MKKISVTALVVLSLVFTAHAEAAKSKRRTRNADRIGPYAGALLSMNKYIGDQSQIESDLRDSFDGVVNQNLSIGTDDSDIGYQAQFGYRFNRYVAMEFALTRYGDLKSKASAEIDNGSGGFVPATIGINFNVTGPLISAIGILPLGNKFELYGRAGMLFAAAEREFIVRVDGNLDSFGSSKGDSTEIVYGVGAAWHINPMYTIRLQFERLNDVGDPRATRTEDIDSASLGLLVRF